MSETQRGTAQDALIGAGAGTIIGALAGDGKGAAIGAGVGAAAGHAWSERMEAQKRHMEEATAGTGVQVSQTTDNRLKLDIPSDITFDTGRADIKLAMSLPWKFTSTVRLFTAGKSNDSWVHFVTGNSFLLYRIDN